MTWPQYLPPVHQIAFAAVLATCIIAVLWDALPWNTKRKGPWG